MKYEWDENKSKANWKKHAVSFEEAESVFEDEDAVFLYDEIHSETEDRFKIIGISMEKRELVVCHCYRSDDEVIRIISARRATKNEIMVYERGHE